MIQEDCHAASCKQQRKPGPIWVTPGAVAIKVYAVRNRGSIAYQFAYSLGGLRKRNTFSMEADAKRAATAAAQQIAQGRVNSACVTADERDTLAAAKRILAPLGVTMIPALESYVAAIAKLPPGVSLQEVVDDFVKNHGRAAVSRPVREIVEEFLGTKERAGRSTRHLDTLRPHCRRFAEEFRCEISRITSGEIDAWLYRNAPRSRARKNLRSSIINLFGFAKKRGYLPRNATHEAELTEQPTTTRAPIGILSPEEYATVLRVMKGEAQLYAALGGLSGVRSAEMMRLKWENIQDGVIEVPARDAKTGQRRLVQICDSLKQWIALHRRPSGPLFTRKMAQHVFTKHIHRVLPHWPRNALRHSFISYHVAVFKDVPAVALEAGNSPAVVLRDYRQIRLPDGRLLTETLGAQWFAIRPGG